MSKDDQSVVFNARQILDILPHRYPFLLVDRVTHIDLEENTIVGEKCVTMNEPFFQGHFPGAPIMPGVLMLEALAQIGGILVHQKGFAHKIAVLLNMSQVKFRRQVGPGDVLQLQAQGLHFTSRAGKVSAKALVRGQVAVEAQISYALVDKEQL